MTDRRSFIGAPALLATPLAARSRADQVVE